LKYISKSNAQEYETGQCSNILTEQKQVRQQNTIPAIYAWLIQRVVT